MSGKRLCIRFTCFLSYQSAYLKVYFPEEFYLAILNNQPGLYPPGVILNEAKRCGIPILGFSFTGHPIELFRKAFKGKNRIKSGKLTSLRENERVEVAGVKIILHTPPTKSGIRVIFLTLEERV